MEDATMKLQNLTSSILFAPLAATLLLVGAGCGSEETPPAQQVPPAPTVAPQVPSDPAGYFTQEVYPRLEASCGDCHADAAAAAAPKYLGSDAATALASIQANAKLYQAAVTSLLVKKGEHQGPALKPDEASAVIHWLDLAFPPEQNAPVDPTSPLSGVDQALAEFGECMDVGDWQQTGMSEFPKTQTEDSGPCAGCHWAGLGGTFLNMDFQITFEAMRQQPYILKLVEPSYDASGKFVGLKQSRRLLDKGTEFCPEINQDDFDICHPEFDFGIDQIQETRVAGFVLGTLSRLNADGSCGAL